MQSHWKSHQGLIKQAMCNHLYTMKRLGQLLLTYGSVSSWGVTDQSMGSGNTRKPHHAHALAPLHELLHPDPAWMWITQESHIYFVQVQVILFESIFASRWFALFSHAWRI